MKIFQPGIDLCIIVIMVISGSYFVCLLWIRLGDKCLMIQVKIHKHIVPEVSMTNKTEHICHIYGKNKRLK